jgi:HD-GYP domain-containing protein (c-di-GMP phosphodiesterase class II)
MIEKSNETAEHAERLVNYSKIIGQAINLSDKELFYLELSAALHDIGKMSIDHRILSKKGKLTEREWQEIKRHPEVGYRIAQSTIELMPIAEFILAHHERWDGNGYPQGLKGHEIPIISRIISIVDSFDAMTENRAYRPALSKDEAIEEIKNNLGTQFDPELAKLFIDRIRNN